ncbi:MAG: hypothetical protein RLZ50_1371, partial [Bacteroidota bacterium]
GHEAKAENKTEAAHDTKAEHKTEAAHK